MFKPADFGTIWFDLELKTDTSRESSESKQYFSAVADEVRREVAESHPLLTLQRGVAMSGFYGSKARGPTLRGVADVGPFKRAFGENVRRGLDVNFISLEVPFIPFKIPVPIELETVWYPIGDLKVPEMLSDLVSGVYLSRYGQGSFGIENRSLWTPRRATVY